MVEKKENLPLLDYLDGLVEELRGLAGRAVTDDDIDTVHDARVASRRLKAAMDLLGPVISKRSRRPFEKIIRRLRKRLGNLRDTDVMLEHLSKIKSSRHEPAVKWMKEQLELSRQDVKTRAADKLPEARVLAKLGTWWGLRQEIAAAGEAVGSMLAESVHLQLDAFAEQAGKMTESGGDPHQFRIAGKSLRYTLEMAQEHGIKLARPVLSSFKRIQTALGLWHDYIVLTQCVMGQSLDHDLAHHHPAEQEALLALAAMTMKRAQQQLGKVSQLWKSSGQELSEQIRGSFPLTEVVKEPVVDELALPFPTVEETASGG